MNSELRSIIQHVLTGLLYVSAGLGAIAYALFLRMRQNLLTFEKTHGLIADAAVFNPREVLEQKLRSIEALRGLAIVAMLVGFLFWPIIFIGVLLFFFQTNAWKSTQRELFTLDRDHPDYKQAHQKNIDALEKSAQAEMQNLKNRSNKLQRSFAIIMAVALVFAVSLLILLMTGEPKVITTT